MKRGNYEGKKKVRVVEPSLFICISTYWKKDRDNELG
jgi:hypothetical protein